jgi:hypothetical protein
VQIGLVAINVVDVIAVGMQENMIQIIFRVIELEEIKKKVNNNKLIKQKEMEMFLLHLLLIKQQIQ